jgi:hypothetical protein
VNPVPDPLFFRKSGSAGDTLKTQKQTEEIKATQQNFESVVTSHLYHFTLTATLQKILPITVTIYSIVLSPIHNYSL